MFMATDSQHKAAERRRIDCHGLSTVSASKLKTLAKNSRQTGPLKLEEPGLFETATGPFLHQRKVAVYPCEATEDRQAVAPTATIPPISNGSFLGMGEKTAKAEFGSVANNTPFGVAAKEAAIMSTRACCGRHGHARGIGPTRGVGKVKAAARTMRLEWPDPPFVWQLAIDRHSIGPKLGRMRRAS